MKRRKSTLRSVTITVSERTYRLLAMIAVRGMHGSGVDGVVEGFVYRGLQESVEPERVSLPAAPRPPCREPRLLVLPEAKDFDKSKTGSYGPLLTIGMGDKWHPNTRASLLGWVGLAFDDVMAARGHPGPAATRFLLEFVKAAGFVSSRAKMPTPEGVAHRAEKMFDQMKRRRAAEAWRKAAEACGYDVEGAR